MDAFIERVWCPSGIVRVGSGCKSYGDDFEFAVQFSMPWKSVALYLLGLRPVPVVVKALVAPCKFEISHGMAIVRTLRARGMRPTWESVRHEKGPGSAPGPVSP